MPKEKKSLAKEWQDITNDKKQEIELNKQLRVQNSKL